MGKLCAVVFCVCSMSVAGQAQTSADRVAGEPVSVVSPVVGPVVAEPRHSGGIHWGPLVREWWTFVAIEQTERIIKESKTRKSTERTVFSRLVRHRFGVPLR